MARKAKKQMSKEDAEIREFFDVTLPNMTPAEREAGNERLRKAAEIYRSGDLKAIRKLEKETGVDKL